MKGTIGHDIDHARAAADKKAELKRAKRERKREHKRRQRGNRLAGLAAFAIIVVMCFSTMYYSAEKTKLKDEVETKKAQLAQLESEYISLNARKEKSYDLEQIEEYAKNVLGMVKMDRSREEYLELQKTDQVEVSNGSSGVEKLVSGFVKSFNAIMSFLR